MNFSWCFLNCSSKATTVSTKCCQIGALQVLPLSFTQLKSGSNILAKMPFQLVPNRSPGWPVERTVPFRHSLLYIYIYIQEEEEEEEEEETVN